MKLKISLMALVPIVCFNMVLSAQIDWRKVSTLQDEAFLAYVEELGLTGQASLDFWKKIPLSRANRQVYSIFRREAFAIYMNKYPRPRGKTPVFTVGMGTEIIGPMSKQTLKLPFTGYSALEKGPVGNPEKTYHFGYTIHGFDHPWLLNNADSALWEAGRHSNVRLTVLDPKFDNIEQVRQIDAWIAEGLDGIMIWPMQEAPTGPPVDRALAAGIPCVSVDRMAGTLKINARVTGNFPANGAQQGKCFRHRNHHG